MGVATIERADIAPALPAEKTLADRHPAVSASPPVRSQTRTLGQEAFDAACARLMEQVERDFAPVLLVGVRTGGLVVARSMARAATRATPVLPLTCRRPATGLKSRVPGLRTMLGAIPESWRDALRQVEHRLSSRRRRGAHPPPVDHQEACAIDAWLRASPDHPRVLVADDAVDSGVTLNTVLSMLRALCPPATDLRSAAITVTLDNPVVEPDYALYRGVLCRFPWSFDAGA